MTSKPPSSPTAGTHDEATSELVAVGRIQSPWGIKGWFKVKAYSAHADALFHADRWIVRKHNELRAKAQSQTLDIDQIKDHGKGIVAKAVDVSDRTAAEQWKNWEICIPRSEFPATQDNEYYWVDLIGLEVINLQGHSMGRVNSLTETGPHDVLILQYDDGKERLIPFVETYVHQVDMEQKVITVDWQSDY